MDFLRKLVGTPDGQANLETRGAAPVPGNGAPADLPAVRADIEAVDRRASALGGVLDDLQARLSGLRGTVRTVEDLEARVVALERAVKQAEARADQATERADRAETERELLQQLLSQGTDTVARLEALHPIGGDLERLWQQLPAARDECRQVLVQQGALTRDTELLQGTVAELGEKATGLRGEWFEARENADRAVRAVAEVQEKLEALSRFDTVSRDTSAQLQALNVLAERATSKLKALDQQHQTIEHAIVESRKVSEMVWNMDAQIARLNEGSALADRVQETVARLEQLQQETTAELADAVRARTQFTDGLEQHRRDATELQQALQGRLDQLALHRQELQTFGERLATAQSALADMERRVAAASLIDKTVRGLGEQIDALSGRLGDLDGAARTLGERQAALAALEARLTEAEETAKRTGWRIESLAERRRDLDDLQAAFAEIDSTHAAARTLLEQLRADREELAQFVERTAAFMRDVPATSAAIEALQRSVAEAEARAGRVADMEPMLDGLAGQAERLAPRVQLVEHVQARLNDLHELAADVDGKLAAQLARQAEVDALRVACDGLSVRVIDAQHNCATLSEAQDRLASIPGQIAEIDTTIAATRAQVQGLQQDEEALAARERRLASLGESAAAASRDLAGRLDSIRALEGDLARVADVKEQLGALLGQFQSLHRDTVAGCREAEDQLHQLGARVEDIDVRRSRVEQAERVIADVERRLGELERSSDAVEAKIEAIQGRARIVDAVKHEVDAIHAVARRAQDDLAAVGDRHAQIAEARVEVQRLLDGLAGVTARVADVEARGAVVEEVRRKADAIAGLLDDMQVTLDTIGEQKTMVDHVAEQFARLDQIITEARGTTKALQAERKLSQRIVETIRSVHARAGADIRRVG